MIKKIFLVILTIVFQIAFIFCHAQGYKVKYHPYPDSIIYNGTKYKLSKPIELSDYVAHMDASLKRYMDFSAGKGYRCVLEVQNDSLFLSQLIFFTMPQYDSLLRSTFFPVHFQNRIFIPGIKDSLFFSFGKITRQNKLCINYEYEMKLIVEGSRVEWDTVFTSFDKKHLVNLPRTSQEVVLTTILNYLNTNINRDSIITVYENKFVDEESKKRMSAYELNLSGDFRFKINKKGVIESIHMFHKDTFSAFISNRLLTIGMWEPMRRRGELLEEEFQLNVYFDFSEHLFKGRLNYLNIR